MLNFINRMKKFFFFITLILTLPVMTEAVVPQISLMKLIDGLSQPVHITHAGDGTGRIFVVDQPGRIRIIRDGVLLPTSFLNISSTAQNPADRKVLFVGEQGLLSVAFPPNFSTWMNVPGALAQLVSGDFNPARAGDELAGLALNGSIWVSTNLSSWTNIPGIMTQFVSGAFNGVAPDDLMGMAMDGSLWLTTDRLNWTNLGQLP